VIIVFSLRIPEISSTLRILEPILHSATYPLKTTTPLILCSTTSPFWKSPVMPRSATAYFDVIVDDTVLSRWNAPPFLIMLTLRGTPISLLSANRSVSPSMILIVGV